MTGASYLKFHTCLSQSQRGNRHHHLPLKQPPLNYLHVAAGSPPRRAVGGLSKRRNQASPRRVSARKMPCAHRCHRHPAWGPSGDVRNNPPLQTHQRPRARKGFTFRRKTHWSRTRYPSARNPSPQAYGPKRLVLIVTPRSGLWGPAPPPGAPLRDPHRGPGTTWSTPAGLADPSPPSREQVKPPNPPRAASCPEPSACRLISPPSVPGGQAAEGGTSRQGQACPPPGHPGFRRNLTSGDVEPPPSGGPWTHKRLPKGSHELAAAAAAKSLQSCPTLCDPIDGSPPGFPVPGILQARTLEWVGRRLF